MKTILLIDWQNNDYRNSEASHCDAAIVNASRLLDDWRARKNRVIHLFLDSTKFFNSNTWRKKRLKEAKMILDNSIIRNFAPQEGEDVIWKSDRSAFRDTNLRELLVPYQKVYCTGAATTGCVLATAIDGDALGYEMIFVGDCMFDKNEERHAKGLHLLSKFGKIIKSHDIP